jgi:hypothetical protein
MALLCCLPATMQRAIGSTPTPLFPASIRAKFTVVGADEAGTGQGLHAPGFRRHRSNRPPSGRATVAGATEERRGRRGQ